MPRRQRQEEIKSRRRRDKGGMREASNVAKGRSGEAEGVAICESPVDRSNDLVY